MRWRNATGDFEQKTKATIGCDRCNGNPPLLTQSNSPEAIKLRLIFHIENLVRQQNAGTLNLDLLDYFDWKLLEIWRDEEQRRERLFKFETHLIFKALLQQRQI